MFYCYQKMSEIIVMALIFPKICKKWQFLETRALPLIKISPAVKCSFKGYASWFGAGKAKLKIVARRSIEYYCFIFITLYILFILLMLSKRIKKINKKIYIGGMPKIGVITYILHGVVKSVLYCHGSGSLFIIRKCPIQVPPVTRFYLSNKLMAVLVSGFQRIKAVCGFHARLPEGVAGFAE
jgi:hypothetical protein